MFSFGLQAKATENQPVQFNIPSSDLGNFVLIPFSDGEAYNNPKIYLTVGPVHMVDPRNLPAVRSQGPLPICTLECVTTLVEYKLCQEMNIQDCPTREEDQRVSRLSTLKYRDTDFPKVEKVIGNFAARNKAISFQVMNNITSAAGGQYFFSESCLSYDAFIENFRNITQPKKMSILDVEIKLHDYLESMKPLFARAKGEIESRANISRCKDCLVLKEKFRIFFRNSGSLEQLATALKLKSFNEFMHEMIFEVQLENNPKCKLIKFEEDLYALRFPEPGDPPTGLNAIFEKIDEVIADRKPVIISPLCIARNESDKSCEKHCIVITGRKTVMKIVNNLPAGPQIELIQVHNSWGQDWQTNNNDGWLPLERFKSLLTTKDDSEAKMDPSGRRDAFHHTITWFN